MEHRISVFNGTETKYLEFKREYSNSVLKTVSALANYHDGRIVIGVDDNGEVVGISQNIMQLRLSIENAINDNIDPRPYFEIETKAFGGKYIAVIKVFKGEFTPYYYKNKAYKRSDTASVELDRFELQKLIMEGQNFSFEELESNNQELEFDYLEKKLRKNKKINTLNQDILKTLELIKSGRFTNSAALLSDNNPLDNAVVILIKYSPELMNIKDKMTLKNMSLIQQFDNSMDFYHKHISVQEIISGPYREIKESIPLVAYREAVANAIVHRDYMAKGDIRIELFEDRIEIVSPGGLPSGISEEEYMDGRLSVVRNPVIADICLRLGIIEKLATGIRRIKEHYINSASQPKFDVMENSIKVVLPVIVYGSKQQAAVDYTGLKGDEIKIIEYLKVKGEITRCEAEQVVQKGKTKTSAIIRRLVDEGYIFAVGRGKNTRYLLNII